MRLYLFEVRCLGKSIFGWCVGLCAMVGLYLTLYPMLRSLNFDLAALFSQFPPTLQALFGMTGLDTNRFSGYLTFPLKLAQELTAIGGLLVGTFAATHDAKDDCADFLFSKPISRSRVLAAKLAAVVTAGAVLYGVFALFLDSAAKFLAPAEKLARSSVLAAAALPVLMFFLYGAAGLLLGTALPRIRGVAAIGIGSMFFFHLVFSIGKVLTGNPDAPLVRALVPVCMFDRALAAGQGRLETPFLLLWAGEVLLMTAGSFLLLRRRDIV